MINILLIFTVVLDIAIKYSLLTAFDISFDYSNIYVIGGFLAATSILFITYSHFKNSNISKKYNDIGLLILIPVIESFCIFKLINTFNFHQKDFVEITVIIAILITTFYKAKISHKISKGE